MSAREPDNRGEQEARGKRVFRFDVEIDDASQQQPPPRYSIGTPIEVDDEVPPPSEWPAESFTPIAPPAKREKAKPLPAEETVPLERALPPIDPPQAHEPSIAEAEVAQVRDLGELSSPPPAPEKSEPKREPKRRPAKGKGRATAPKKARPAKGRPKRRAQKPSSPGLWERLRAALTRDVTPRRAKGAEQDPKKGELRREQMPVVAEAPASQQKTRPVEAGAAPSAPAQERAQQPEGRDAEKPKRKKRGSRLRAALTRDVNVRRAKDSKRTSDAAQADREEVPPPSAASEPASPEGEQPERAEGVRRRVSAQPSAAGKPAGLAGLWARLRAALTRDVGPRRAKDAERAPREAQEQKSERVREQAAPSAPSAGAQARERSALEPGAEVEEPKPTPAAPEAPAPERVPESQAPAQPEPEEGPAPVRRGTRRLVGSDEETGHERAERERAERERRRLERRKREEERRERKQRRERAVRRARELVVGFVRSQLDEESEAWSKRRERLAERKRKREEKRLERERKREEKKRRREENPNALDKLRMRFHAWRAARARKATRNIVGLEIGASALRAVHLREGHAIEIIERPLPGGVIIDGKLEDPGYLTDALKEMWRVDALKTKKVNFSIANHLVTLRTISLAAENPEDVPQALALMAGEVIEPMQPEESIIDYAELSRTGVRSNLQVAAANEEMVKTYTQAVEKAGLLPVSCELGPLAASRALVVPRSPRKAHLLVDVGAERTTVTAASGPDVFYFRSIQTGGNNFTEAIRKELGVSFAEAEELKRRIGLEGEIPAGIDPEQARAARRVMRPVADQLCQEISQTKRAYEEAIFEGERVGREIEGWFLLGGGAKLRGLDRQIEIFVGLPPRKELRPHPQVEGAPDLDLTATCLGLARGHTMSLLPQVAPTSFRLANPFRRKPKISLDDAERQGKRLAAKRNDKQKTDPRLLGLLGALGVLAGAFYLGQGSKPEGTAMVDPMLDQGGAQVKLVYPQNNRATQVAEALQATPQSASLRPLPKAFAQHKAQISRITVTDTRVVISATSNSAVAAERVERSVRKSVPDAVSIQMQKEKSSGNEHTFTIVIDIPHDPKANG